MKKKFTVLLTMLLVLSMLAGCGSNTNTAGSAETAQAAQQETPQAEADRAEEIAEEQHGRLD